MKSNIRDELKEFIHLENPHLLISEFVPFGANNVYEFCNKLDATKRVKSALLTEFIDKNPGGTIFETNPILTRVEVTNFSNASFVEFQSQIFYPEEEGIEQIEQFGVRIDASGRVLYGLEVQSVDGEKSPSLDKLSRVLADVIFDSSKMLSSLLTHHQRQLLDLVFFDNSQHRDKYSCIFAAGMNPSLPISDYLDSGDLENELKQILEYVDSVEDLPGGGKLFVGTHGLILISPQFQEYELIFSQFLFLKSVEIFLSNFFSRTWAVSDQLERVRGILTEEINKDPRATALVQTEISKASSQVIFLEEILEFLDESLSQSLQEWSQFRETFNETQESVAVRLGVAQYLQNSQERVQDTRKIIHGISNEIQGLRDQINVINEKRLQSIFTQLKAGTTIQHKTQRAAERQESGTKILEIILSGSLAFELVSLTLGEYSFVDSGRPFESPILWFFLNLGIWLIFSLGIFLIMRFLTKRAEKLMLVKLNFEREVDLSALDAYLDQHAIIKSDIEVTEHAVLRTVKFLYPPGSDSPFKHHEVDVELVYDMKNGFLYNIILEITRPHEPEKFFKQTMRQELKRYGILLSK